jgi:hypothetical protein
MLMGKFQATVSSVSKTTSLFSNSGVFRSMVKSTPFNFSGLWNEHRFIDIHNQFFTVFMTSSWSEVYIPLIELHSNTTD